MSQNNELIEQIERIHTTPLGVERIRRNLRLDDEVDVVAWCKEKCLSSQAQINRQGKNWYVEVENSRITINAYSYTIITAHLKKA